MVVITDIAKKQGIASAVALGFFDGVHLAHQAVIARAVSKARDGLVPCVFTFDSAGAIPAGKKGLTLLQTESQKDRVLERLGVSRVFCPDFEVFRMLEPKAFVEEILIGNLGARVLTCGYNYHFGKGASGGVEDLRALCRPFGVTVEAVEPVILDGQVISSTRIREAVRCGDMELARRMLGSPFSLDTPAEDASEGASGILVQRFPRDFTLPPPGRYRSCVEVAGRMIPGITTVEAGRAPFCRTVLLKRLPGGRFPRGGIPVEFLEPLGQDSPLEAAWECREDAGRGPGQEAYRSKAPAAVGAGDNAS